MKEALVQKMSDEKRQEHDEKKQQEQNRKRKRTDEENLKEMQKNASKRNDEYEGREALEVSTHNLRGTSEKKLSACATNFPRHLEARFYQGI